MPIRPWLPLWMAVGGLLAGCNNNNPDGSKEPAPGPQVIDPEFPSHFSDRNIIPEDNPITVEGVELGRFLFYDSTLSADSSVSCATCHHQEKAFTDGKALAEGIHGRKGSKNAMSLANLMWTNRFFWNGRSPSLEDQALEPIEDPKEMGLELEKAVERIRQNPLYPPKFEAAFGSKEVSAERIGRAIAQFERTLISHNSKYDQYLRGDYQPSDLELEGIDLFFTHPSPEDSLRGGNCGDCHLGALTSGDLRGTKGFHNNGLDPDGEMAPGLEVVTGRSSDRGRMKAVTLRNIELTAPYMHDGRFQTLEQVLDHYDDHIHFNSNLDPLIIQATNNPYPNRDSIDLGLTNHEKKAIIAFLKMLTDKQFIENEKFSDPFNQ